MIYKDREELLRGYLNWLESLHSPGVYHQAVCDPPEGVIGVGAITYAEHKLVEAQQ
jgi:hypothetical protein